MSLTFPQSLASLWMFYIFLVVSLLAAGYASQEINDYYLTQQLFLLVYWEAN